MSHALREQVTQFFVSMQAPDGGLRAGAFAPAADLLSTFTALAACVELGTADRLAIDRLRLFACENELGSGGFRAGSWDDVADVEYTFYGLGTIGLCAAARTPGAGRLD